MAKFESVYGENELIFGLSTRPKGCITRSDYVAKVRSKYPFSKIFIPEDILNEFIGWYVSDPNGWKKLSGIYPLGMGASDQEIIDYTLIQQSYGYGISGDKPGDLFDVKNGSKPVVNFKNYLEKHTSYGPFNQYSKKGFTGDKTNKEYFATRLRTKHACKCMIEYALFVLEQKIHFVLDGLNLKAVAEKDETIEKTYLHVITHKELRKLCRIWFFEPSIRTRVYFWRDFCDVKPPWFSEDLGIRASWKTYVEGVTRKKMLRSFNIDEEESLLQDYKKIREHWKRLNPHFTFSSYK